MSYAEKPRSRAHLVVLFLCVSGCLVSALWPRPEPEPTPADDAAVLMRGVISRVLGDEPQLPPAH